MIRSVAILAGGLATRLRPITERVPKVLVEVAGKPFAAHQIELLRQHGLTDITFLVGHMGDQVREAIGDGAQWGVRVRYAPDGPTPLGTGGAVAQALPLLDDRFFVMYGDSYLECDIEAIGGAFIESGQPALMTVLGNDDRWDRSNVQFVHGRILAYDKAAPTPAMRHIDYGLGVFHRRAFDAYGKGDAFDLAAVYQHLIAKNDLAGYEVSARFYEIGSASGLEETRAHLAAKGRSIP